MANRKDGFILRTKIKTDNVVLATIKLISLHPFEDITIAMIAKKAKVSQVTIYNHFKNKEAVIIEAIKKLALDNVERIHQIIMSHIPARNRLYLYFENSFLQAVERPRLDQIKVYIREGNVDELKQYIDEIFATTDHHLTRLYNDAKREGLLRDEITKTTFLRMLEMYTRTSVEYLKDKTERHLIIESLIRSFGA